MGWVATPELVAASSNAGAFGFLALATCGPEEAIEMIEKTLTPVSYTHLTLPTTPYV